MLALTGVGVLTGGYAWQVEPFWLEFVKVNMPVQNLPADLKGKTIMQISDIHVGKRFDHRYLIESFKLARELAPDIVVYTGDYVSIFEGEVQYKELREVLDHSVKGRLGTVAILGNHDYGRNWSEPSVADSISEQFLMRGITVLRNR